MNEWENIKARLRDNAKKVDMRAEREKFEQWQTHCGITNSTYHDDEYGYGGFVPARLFDRWDAWLARAAEEA